MARMAVHSARLVPAGGPAQGIRPAGRARRRRRPNNGRSVNSASPSRHERGNCLSGPVREPPGRDPAVLTASPDRTTHRPVRLLNSCPTGAYVQPKRPPRRRRRRRTSPRGAGPSVGARRSGFPAAAGLRKPQQDLHHRCAQQARLSRRPLGSCCTACRWIRVTFPLKPNSGSSTRRAAAFLQDRAAMANTLETGSFPARGRVETSRFQRGKVGHLP